MTLHNLCLNCDTRIPRAKRYCPACQAIKERWAKGGSNLRVDSFGRFHETLGMDVTLRLLVDGQHKTEQLHNVTEIHYNYPSLEATRVAFESDVHGTGITYDLGPGRLQLLEFEAKLATGIAEEF